MIPRVRVVAVDMNGFLGRDFHPQPSDIGTIAVIIKSEAYFIDEKNGIEEVIGADGRLFQGFKDAEDYDDVYWVFTCVTEDNRILELISHEVEHYDVIPQHYK